MPEPVPPPLTPLPIDDLLPALHSALASHGAAVVVAAPGAGKSTRVAPALVTDGGGQVLLLQPRRIAARSVAARIAAERGEVVGAVIGYHVRHDKQGDAATRLWVLTEGILTRRLQHDPYLEGVSAVLLDEFHERSLHVDIALAWLAELRRTLRPDLQVVVMSATIDAQPVADFLGGCPVLSSSGRQYPVAVHYQGAPPRTPIVDQVAAGVERALQEVDAGDVLAFMPGVGEINGCIRVLSQRGIDALPLHGSLSAAEQDRALRTAGDGRRRVIVATNVAETSLTIEGVRSVIDSGLHRVQRFDPERGLPVLRLEQISRWNAEQRSGRAGRTSAGWSLRCWSRLEQQRLSQAPGAEISHADLAPLVMDLRAIHGNDVRTFPWFEAPAAEQLEAAESLLALLGLIERPFAGLSERGRYVQGLAVHPRLSCLLLAAEERGCMAMGAALAACLSERSLRRRDAPAPQQARWADCEDDLHLLSSGPNHPDVHPAAHRQVDLLRRDLCRAWGQSSATMIDLSRDAEHLPALLLAAYPDRVAKRRAPGQNRVQWATGSGDLAAHSVCAVRPGQQGEALCVAYSVRGLDGRSRRSTVVEGAAVLDMALLQRSHPQAFAEGVECVWHPQKEQVEAAKVRRFGSLVLSYEAGAAMDPQRAAALLADHLAPRWQEVLQRFPAAWSWWQRVQWLQHQRPAWHLVGDHQRGDDGGAEDPWQQSFIQAWAATGHGAMAKLSDPLPLLEGLLTYEQRQYVESMAPSHCLLPNGQRRALDYGRATEPPTLRVRIQHCFGWRDGPRVLGGELAVRLELLAPNDRPQQTTDDLAGFWSGSYALVRKDLRGRYPKHPWPEDPAAAEPLRPRPPKRSP